MSADALVVCRPTRWLCVGGASLDAVADASADASMGSYSLPFPEILSLTQLTNGSYFWYEHVANDCLFLFILVTLPHLSYQAHQRVKRQMIQKMKTLNLRKKVTFMKLIQCKGFEPEGDSRSCSVIVRVRVVLKRTVVSDSD